MRLAGFVLVEAQAEHLAARFNLDARRRESGEGVPVILHQEVSDTDSAGQEHAATFNADARLTSKGQVTIPRSVREALGLGDGDHVVFRVEGHRAVLARTADLLDLAGVVEVPAEKRGGSWDEVRRRTRAARFRHEP